MNRSKTVLHVVGPEGEQMTTADLPRTTTRRWVAKRKARVVFAVEGGLISRSEAFERYGLTEEEYRRWKASLAQFGVKGLRVIKRQEMQKLQKSLKE